MARYLNLTLLMVLISSCSNDNGFVVAPPSPPPSVPTVDCLIERWVNIVGDGVSYEFDYEGSRLAGLVITDPASQWPMQYDFQYTEETLTKMVLTRGEGFEEYDSLVVQVNYNNQDRLTGFISTEFLNGNQIHERVQELNNDTQRFVLRPEVPGTGPFTVFYIDNAGNIQRIENYNEKSTLIDVEIGEFDSRPSPFKDFPLAFKIYFREHIGLSWANNMIRNACEVIADDEVFVKEIDYTYNEEGYPTTSSNQEGTIVYRMDYLNCE